MRQEPPQSKWNSGTHRDFIRRIFKDLGGGNRVSPATGDPASSLAPFKAAGRNGGALASDAGSMTGPSSRREALSASRAVKARCADFGRSYQSCHSDPLEVVMSWILEGRLGELRETFTLA
jgi:hypothetical protein